MGSKVAYDIFGDVHGCFDELNQLCVKLGYEWSKEFQFYVPSSNRMAIFVGDLIDRGPKSAEVFNQIMTWIRINSAMVVKGNHDDKFGRWCKGRNVKIGHGLQETINQIDKFIWTKEQIAEIIDCMPQYLKLDKGRLIVVHAAWHKELNEVNPFSKTCRNWCLYGPSRGLKPDGMPDRIDWVEQRTDKEPIIVYGHYPRANVRILNNTYGIDTACVFGNYLSCLTYPDMTITNQKAFKKYASGSFDK